MKSKKQNEEYIFVAWITTRSGKRIYARNYGLKAFKIRVKRAA